MRRLINTILLLSLLLPFSAQQGAAQDFVVTVQGDTLRGKLKPITQGPDKKVTVISADRERTSVPILKIKTFSFENDRYEPVRRESGYEFMKMIKPGYLSLYGFQMQNQTGFDGMFLVKKDGEYLEVPNLSFRKLMQKFLGDCPDVTAKIESGEWDRKELATIVDEYNQCIEDRTNESMNELTNQRKAAIETQTWSSLEQKISEHPDFNGKEDALEMIRDIRGKISRGEKLPKFLLEGLKDSLAETDLSDDLQQVLAKTEG